MRRKIAVSFLLAMLTGIAYFGAAKCDFVEYDDPVFVTEFPRVQQGLSWDNIKWAMVISDFEYWHPLVWMSHMLDCQLFGLNPRGHHLMNVGFHVLGTITLFWVLESLTRRIGPSVVVAALFAVHPLHVESVAWVAERKDVMSAPFFFAAMGAYAAWARRQQYRWYALSALLYLLALACKPMAMTLPAVLLLLDVWPLHRVPWPENLPSCASTIPLRRNTLDRLFVEKLPLFAMSIACLIFTARAQRAAGTMSNLRQTAPSLRLANAAVSYCTYLGKLFLPVNLAAFYPFPHSIGVAITVAADLVLVALSLAALRLIKRKPYVAVGWFWFVGTLLPVIGILQVGPQARADRYTYLPAVGIFIAVVWWIADLNAGRRWSARLSAVTACGAILALTLACQNQVRYWKNSQTLFLHAIDVTEDNWLANYCLGTDSAKHGDYAAAIGALTEAIRINPKFADAYNNLGNCIYLVNPAAAIPIYQHAAELAPTDAKGHLNLGNAYFATGQGELARNEFIAAVRLSPSSSYARERLAASESPVMNPIPR